MDACDRLRLAACLATAVPGVALELIGVGGRRLVVADRRLDADLSAGQLRAMVAQSRRRRCEGLLAPLGHIVVGHGLEHLGGGLYRRSDGSGAQERWFATLLDPDHVRAVLAGRAGRVHELVGIRLVGDPLLTAAVCVTAPSGTPVAGIAGVCVDDIAYQMLAACMVGELAPAQQDCPGR